MKTFLGLMGAMILLACPSQAEVLLDPFFSDNMVLQVGQKNRIWGTHTATEEIWVQYGARPEKATVRKDGTWEIHLSVNQSAEGNSLLVWEGRSRTRLNSVAVLRNVVAGDVWLVGLCPDQGLSIQLLMGRTNTLPNIRVTALQAGGFSPWQVCSTGMRNLSVFSYHYARQLGSEETPVGIIQVRESEITKGLTENYRTARRGREERFVSDFDALKTRALTDTERDLKYFKVAQEKAKIQAKHNDSVWPELIVQDYQAMEVLHPDDFNDAALQTLNFKGAILNRCR